MTAPASSQPLSAWRSSLRSELSSLSEVIRAPGLLPVEAWRSACARQEELSALVELCFAAQSALHEATLAADDPDMAVPLTPWGLAGYAVGLLQGEGWPIPSELPALLRDQAAQDVLGSDVIEASGAWIGGAA